MNKSVSRRSFLTRTGIATAGVMVVPRHVLGGPGYTAPSDKLNIAAIGTGGMGSGNTDRCAGENIVALCDVDFERAASQFKKYPKAKQFKDFRHMLEKQKEIDAVIVATPDHSHALAALTAMKLGKHVYVQKPLTHNVYEARKLTEAAHKYNVATQMGNQGRSGEGTRRLAEWIWSGAIGEVGAGALGDMGCHILDPVFHALKLKYPMWVQGSHSYDVPTMWKRFENNETYPRASMITYRFPAREGMPPVTLKWYDGGILPEWPAELDGAKIPMGGGSMFVGDKGVIICGTYGGDVQMFPEERFMEYKDVPKTLTRIKGGHEQNWIEACKGGEAACSNFDYSGPLTEMVLMGNLAIRVPGTRLLWDGENMKVTNHEDANRFIKREYRKGWEV